MLISRPVPALRPLRPCRKSRLATLTTLGLAGLLVGLLAGCGSSNSPAISTASQTSAFNAIAGNWKFTAASTARPAAFAGALSVAGTSVTGTLHALPGTCTTSAAPFQVAGNIDATGSSSITSSNFDGGRLLISGTLAEDRHSLLAPSVTITGGACATPATLSAHILLSASAQQYQPLTGNYNGTFTDLSGATLTVAASLSQPTTPDTNGVYHLTGFATFPNTPCLNAPVITDSTVTGDSIQATYTDTATGNTVSGTGTLSPDAQTLTITNWILSGCGDDTGTGLLLRQQVH